MAKIDDYRERALKMYPWVCGACGRDFNGKNLKELTVHHKDHNHNNNPLDGSNWELLCVYCHDNEHSRHAVFEARGEEDAVKAYENKTTSTYKAFEGLADLLKKKD
jgi:hypothetical protein